MSSPYDFRNFTQRHAGFELQNPDRAVRAIMKNSQSARLSFVFMKYSDGCCLFDVPTADKGDTPLVGREQRAHFNDAPIIRGDLNVT